MAFNDAEELIYTMLRKQHSFNYPQMPYAIWVKGVDGKKLQDPVIKGRDPQGKPTFVAQAREAELSVDMAHRKLTIRMRFGSVISADGTADANFEAREIPVTLPDGFGKEGKLSPRDMTWNEMLSKRRKYQDYDVIYLKEIQDRIRGGDAAGSAKPLPSPDDLTDAPPTHRQA